MENMFYHPYDDSIIYNNFAFLVDEYDMKNAYQTLELDGGWVYSQHCFYNETGCFTVSTLPNRGELDFYHASKFSHNPKELQEQWVDVFSIKSAVWSKYKKIGFFPIPFPLIRKKRLLEATVEVIKDQIERENTFLDIVVERKQ